MFVNDRAVVAFRHQFPVNVRIAAGDLVVRKRIFYPVAPRGVHQHLMSPAPDVPLANVGGGVAQAV